ncbi:phosphoadenosine phosphosulfate reductase family protein [Pedobacter aquatilis]|uniref:phosphoadenosine phosphosulfate reductase family protein n=1 Tax=Pedobacter aquatilis TaxID=351343 RepID=UPI0025B48680|nr:phosphoadenosine phosphosulfate reductase family protein [Pedobacter aquatilis]MDN3586101.1 phosphoadenosine phosphosulfate reductase family protein [Pedobacter aquatilis]
MAKKVRHVLGISGGKDSAALAIYMKDNYPELDIEYYTADTGKELKETYQLINNLEVYLGKKIIKLRAFDKSPEAPFDHKLKSLGGFLPNTLNRWCTKSLKLDVFEKFVGTDPVISYVGIRGDELREGYISTKETIQSIFPFRQNIWSEEIIKFVLDNKKITALENLAKAHIKGDKLDRFIEILRFPVSELYTREAKLKQLLELSTKDFNAVAYALLKLSSYPVALESHFPLIENEEILKLDDIFALLTKSGVGIPAYYKDIEFEVNGQRATYNRSRSGCYFCFFQQKIEWIWLYEQHPELFAEAMEYERSDFKWNMEESLAELIRPERVEAIKLDYIKRKHRTEKNKKSPKLRDILGSADDVDLACASCFI